VKDFLRRYQERRGKPNIDLSKYLDMIKTLYTIKNMLQKIKGYKTYITGVVGIVTALGGWLTDAISFEEMIAGIFIAIQTMNIRNSIK